MLRRGWVGGGGWRASRVRGAGRRGRESRAHLEVSAAFGLLTLGVVRVERTARARACVGRVGRGVLDFLLGKA